ncbi:hypothetical protein PCE1_004140 [Barthelona sp. PCE]
MKFITFFLIILGLYGVFGAYYYPRPPIARPPNAVCAYPPKESILLGDNHFKNVKNVVLHCGEPSVFHIPLPNSQKPDELEVYLIHKEGVDESGCLVHADSFKERYDITCYPQSHGDYELRFRVGHPFCHSFTITEGRCERKSKHPFISCRSTPITKFRETFRLNEKFRWGSWHVVNINVKNQKIDTCMDPNNILKAPVCTSKQISFDTSVYSTFTTSFDFDSERRLFKNYLNMDGKGKKCYNIIKPHLLEKRLQLFNRKDRCRVPQALMSEGSLFYRAPSHGRQFLGYHLQRYNFEYGYTYAGKKLDISTVKLEHCPIEQPPFNEKTFFRKANNRQLSIKHKWVPPTYYNGIDWPDYRGYRMVLFTTGGWEIMTRSEPSLKYGFIHSSVAKLLHHSKIPVLVMGDPKNEKKPHPSFGQYFITKNLERAVNDLLTTVEPNTKIRFAGLETVSRNNYWNNDSNDSHMNLEMLSVFHDLFSAYYSILHDPANARAHKYKASRSHFYESGNNHKSSNLFVTLPMKY